LEIFTSRRERFQIISEILNFCMRPKKKTHVMYEVNLSFSQLKTHLNKLQKTGLLKLHHSEERYLTTIRAFSSCKKG